MPYPGNRYRPFGLYLPAPPVPTTEVDILDNGFSPPSIKVGPGTTVRWTNKGQKRHTVTELTGAWTSPELAPNDSWSVTLRQPLNHYYYCRHHPLTMNATIVVK
jgi:plastocyanin